MFEELLCTICQRQFSNQSDLVPRLLPECGHTFCTKCLNDCLMLSQPDTPFHCPEDNVECARKPNADAFPKNFALIRLAERTLERQRKEEEERVKQVEEESKAQQDQEQAIAELQRQIAEAENAAKKAAEESKIQQVAEEPAPAVPDGEEQCLEHQRKLEIICIQDRVRICSTCALFGQHKGHDVRMEQEVVNELTSRTELLITMYQIVDDISANRIDQVTVGQMASEFRAKSNELKNNLKEKFNELKILLKIQEQKAETILKKNLAFIENEISKMQKVPQRLFEDADSWSKAARTRLDYFEENLEKPNFINYDLLETKDSTAGPDIIVFGESLVSELEEHKDISMTRVATQIKQLGLNFDQELISKLREVVQCERVEGVEIDENELVNLEEMLREAAHKEPMGSVDPQSDRPSMGPRMSQFSEANPMTRNSLMALAGDENDLLAESPVFAKAKVTQNAGSSDRLGSDMSRSVLTPQVPDDPLDEQLVNEINDYLQGIVEDESTVIEMSDSPIRSQGAECVATALKVSQSVKEIRLSNCEIKDMGAQKLFECLTNSQSVETIDLSGNQLTERCFDAIETCLTMNSKVREVNLTGINVKSNFAWGKFKKFGSIVKH